MTVSKENFFIESIADFKQVDYEKLKAIINELIPDFISPTYIHVYPDDWVDRFDSVDFDENEKPTMAYVEGYDFGIFEKLSYKFMYSFQAKYGEKWVFENKYTPSSRYWYTEEGVYRESDHWGDCKDCTWALEGLNVKSEDPLIGFCKWEEFTIKTQLQCQNQ